MDIAYITGQRIGDVMGIRYADISETGLYVEQEKTRARVLIARNPELSAAVESAKAMHKNVSGVLAAILPPSRCSLLQTP